MGLRGPLPKSDRLRVVAGSRRRRKGDAPIIRTVEPELITMLRDRAVRLERFAYTMLKRAERKPATRTPANGQVVSPEFKAAMDAFAEVNGIISRLARLTTSEPGQEGTSAADPDPLEAFRRAKH